MASTHGSPFHQINIDHLIERERQKLINKANRQKEITLLKFSEERDRKEFLQKILDKKQQKANKQLYKSYKEQKHKRDKFKEKE